MPLRLELAAQLSAPSSRIRRGISERNARSSRLEAVKLDGWADDLKVGLEREIKELDRQIKEARRAATAALTLEEKLAGQKAVKALEAERSAKRRALFDEQDRVDARRAELTEVRGGRSPRIRSFREEIGESYFDYLPSLPDLVLLMDESHRYRATAGMRAINELKPILGLELTATPFIESARPRGLPQRHLRLPARRERWRTISSRSLPSSPARTSIRAGKSPEAIERLKLEDGIRLHESIKVDLETYARENGERIVKPFVLVIARDTTHAGGADDADSVRRLLRGPLRATR